MHTTSPMPSTTEKADLKTRINKYHQEEGRVTKAEDEEWVPNQEYHLDWSVWRRLGDIPRPHLRDIAGNCPLIAAILAPVSTLLDIPALTQKWYLLDGVIQSDPKASLILSAIGLFLNVLANVLLLVRFSTHTKRWVNISTKISLISWLGKTVVAAVNLIIFGILTNNSTGYQFGQGFWCAVVSIIDAGIISVALLIHYFLVFRGNKHPNDESSDIRIQGKQFMVSVTIFIGILAIQSLVFCKIEGWTYLDSIYFSVQTALTIGYGDFAPTTTAGKVLVFVFSVLTISQLGNEITIIVSFFSSKSKERRAKWRRSYEGAVQKEADQRKPRASLYEEMALIHKMTTSEETWSQLYDLFWSAIALIVFWVSGAAIFSNLEGWTYGNALYAVMVLTLTIGFGDFTPESAAGRVVFIVYALMAVPIVTSFVVQTITGLLSTYSDRRAKRDRYRRARREAPDAFQPHASYIVRAHESYQDMRDRLLTVKGDTVPKESDGKDAVSDEASKNQVREELNTAEARILREYNAAEAIVAHAGDHEDDEDSSVAKVDQNKRELELDLIRQLMDLTIQLEAEARELMLESMEHGIPRTLLIADRNVQIRDVKAVRGDDANILSIWRGIGHDNHSNTESSQLSKVRRYRNTFAEILVIGAILQRLDGEELQEFERSKSRPEVRQQEPNEVIQADEDLERIADEQYDGITSKMLKTRMKELRQG